MRLPSFRYPLQIDFIESGTGLPTTSINSAIFPLTCFTVAAMPVFLSTKVEQYLCGGQNLPKLNEVPPINCNSVTPFAIKCSTVHPRRTIDRLKDS